MEDYEALWYFDEARQPICASFTEDGDCDRDVCVFSHDEPVFIASVSIPETLLSDLSSVKTYLITNFSNLSTPIVPLDLPEGLMNGTHS